MKPGLTERQWRRIECKIDRLRRRIEANEQAFAKRVEKMKQEEKKC